MEDLSGLEPSEDGWISPDAIPATLAALMAEIGRVYPPVMLANAQALTSGATWSRPRWTAPAGPSRLFRIKANACNGCGNPMRCCRIRRGRPSSPCCNRRGAVHCSPEHRRWPKGA